MWYSLLSQSPRRLITFSLDFAGSRAAFLCLLIELSFCIFIAIYWHEFHVILHFFHILLICIAHRLWLFFFVIVAVSIFVVYCSPAVLQGGDTCLDGRMVSLQLHEWKTSCQMQFLHSISSGLSIYQILAVSNRSIGQLNWLDGRDNGTISKLLFWWSFVSKGRMLSHSEHLRGQLLPVYLVI